MTRLPLRRLRRPEAGPRARSGSGLRPSWAHLRVPLPLAVVVLLVLGACSPPVDEPRAPSTPATPSATEGRPGGATPSATAPADPAPTSPEPVDPGGEPVETAAPEEGGGDLDVTVTLASWDAASASAALAGFVGSVAEDDGRCTFELTGTGAPRTVVSTGLADATTTVCSARVPRADLAPGTWSVVLTYTSPSGTGRSAAAALEMP